MKQFKVLALMTAVICSLCISACTTTLFRNFVYTDTGVNRPTEFPVLRATGYAVIRRQPGPTADDRIYQAMRASKIEAYRELAEQVEGAYVKTENKLADARENSDQVSFEVEAYVKGARVIRQYPVGDTAYATELELDTRVLYDMYDIRGAF